MNNNKFEELHQTIDGMSDYLLDEIIAFAKFVKIENDKKLHQDMVKSSESSLLFWDNSVDDEVWNNA